MKTGDRMVPRLPAYADRYAVASAGVAAIPYGTEAQQADTQKSKRAGFRNAGGLLRGADIEISLTENNSRGRQLELLTIDDEAAERLAGADVITRTGVGENDDVGRIGAEEVCETAVTVEGQIGR